MLAELELGRLAAGRELAARADPDDPFTDFVPTDVVIRLQPGEMLMVQTLREHQRSAHGVWRQVGINFYRHQGTGPSQDMGTLFATQQAIRICQHRPSVTTPAPASSPTR